MLTRIPLEPTSNSQPKLLKDQVKLMDGLIRVNPPKISRARRWAALAVVLFGQFVVSIDMTVLNIALPDLTAELQPTSDQQLWIIDVYSLVLAGLLVAASSLSDRWGRKRMMLAGFAVFGIGSGLIMFADTTEAVIALRALLGVGAAMIMPTTISMVRSIFLDAKERAFALAGWSAIGGLGMAAGPLIGGFLLEHFSWHAAFLVNVPLMALSFLAGAFILPEIRVKNPGGWDIPAAIMSLAGMTLLMWGIKHVAAIMAFDATGLAALAAGLGLMTAFLIRCARSDSPLLDVSLFRSKPFTAGIVAALGSMFALASLSFLLSQWLQLVDGCSPMEAGARLVPMALTSIIGGVAAPALAMRFNARNVTAAGLAVAAAAMIMLAAFQGNLTYLPVMVSSSLVGLGTGALAVGSSVIMCETPVEKASSAASLEEVSYDLGNVLGVAILGSMASIVYRLGLDPSALAASGLDGASIDEAMQSFGAAAQIARQTGAAELMSEGAAAFSNSIIITSFAGGIVLLAVALIAWKLIPRDLDITEGEH